MLRHRLSAATRPGAAPPVVGDPLPYPLHGGVLGGPMTLGHSLIAIDACAHAAAANKLVLPRTGNVFELSCTPCAGKTSCLVTRINDSGADRFASGTIITLMVEADTVSFAHSATGYIRLLGSNGGPVVGRRWTLTLISDGGVWKELFRSG